MAAGYSLTAAIRFRPGRLASYRVRRTNPMEEGGMWEGKVKPIRALERALDVLQVLQDSKAMELKDLNKATGLPKATLLRVLKTLHSRGLIWRRMADKAYLPSVAWRRRTHPIDDEARLVEVASPILEALCRRVSWPSILAAPRLDYMEVIETNSPVSFVSHIPLGPVGFRINMLRSATGIAYLAYCSEGERSTILARLQSTGRVGDSISHDVDWVSQRLAQVRACGYGFRDPAFGGHFDKPRREYNDGRDSIAAPIVVGDRVLGCVNLTWSTRVAKRATIAVKHLKSLQRATTEIALRMNDDTPAR
jgi:IclR family mhp operon transcriptional activator